MSNQRVIADSDSTLVLEVAPSVDKDTFTKGNIFAAVCIKGWK